jgi:TRAP-type C4-dicarboxylate transport system permease small subunit
VYQIVARNLFDSGLYWGDPLLRVVVLWLAMVGAMLASRQRNHIRIDVLSHYISDRARRLAEVVSSIFSGCICLLAAYYGALFVADERAYGASAFADVPAWWCEAIIPLGLFIIGLRFLLQTMAPVCGRSPGP